MMFRGKLPDDVGKEFEEERKTDLDIEPVSQDLIPTKDLRLGDVKSNVIMLVRARNESRTKAFEECKRKCDKNELEWQGGWKRGWLAGAIMITIGALLLWASWR